MPVFMSEVVVLIISEFHVVFLYVFVFDELLIKAFYLPFFKVVLLNCSAGD